MYLSALLLTSAVGHFFLLISTFGACCLDRVNHRSVRQLGEVDHGVASIP